MFINSAYEVCQTDSAALLNVFVEKNDENGSVGIRLIRALLSNKKIISRASANSHGQVSLEEILVPFLRVVTVGRLLNSTLQPLVNPLVQMISDAIDWTSLTSALDSLAGKPPSSFSSQAQSIDEMWVPKNITEALLPIATFCCEMLQRFDMDKLNQGKEMLRVLKRFQLNEAHADTNKLTRQIMELEGLVESKVSPLERGEILAAFQEKQKKEAGKKKAASAAAKAQTPISDLPGNLCKERRPRHDNDFADINRISVAPTAEEILCEKHPYLPQNRAGTVAHLRQGSKEAHRDLHFRLLRHDLIADLASAVQLLKKKGGIKGLGSNSSFKTEGIMLHAYRNVEICGVDLDRNSGVTYKIKFDQLTFLKGKSPREKTMLWGKNRLGFGTLVCFYDESKGANQQPNIMFGVVTDRKPENLVKERPTISIRLTEGTVDANVLKCALGLKSLSSSEVVMLQGGASFFAYEDILKALKTCYIPLDQYIVTPPANTGVGGLGQKRSVGVPGYLRRARAGFDLSFLASPNASQRDRMALRGIDLSRPDLFPMNALTSATTLDGPQAQAIKAGLTRELALIQGPPGTGKTYVGVQIVRCLLKNRLNPVQSLHSHLHDKPSEFGPILCVCFTNHALDSFLMDLIESGVDGIVRVGGNSKEEALEKSNLREVQKVVSPDQRRMKTQWWGQMDELKEEAAECAKGILSDQNLRWADVSVAVKMDNTNFSRSLKTSVGADCCTLDEAWKKWSMGGPRDPYKSVIEYHRRLNSMQDAEGGAETSNVFDALNENKRVNGKKNQNDKTADSRLDEALFRAGGLRMHDIELMEKQSRPLRELLRYQHIWQMSRLERRRLINHWRGVMFEDAGKHYRTVISEYQDLSTKMKALNEDINLTALRKAKIVGMTTSGVAKHQNLIGALQAKIVIVEEAAEVLEAHILTSLSNSTEHLILIGDHEQLRPKPQLYQLQEDSRAGYNLDVSLFERLITQGNLPYITLETQRRMRPQFSRLIKETIYPNLTNHDVVTKYPAKVKGMEKTMFFLDHDHPENGDKEGTSKSNDFEAHFAIKLARYLTQQHCYKDGEIAIITPYVGQLLKIKKAMSDSNIKVVMAATDQDLLQEFIEGKQDDDERQGDASLRHGQAASRVALRECIRVATVDNFQGEEAKVVILSLTRNKKEGHIGFLGNRNRANVMLSRAKHGMYVLGNKQSMKACKKKDSIWADVIDLMEAEGCVGKAIELSCEIHPGHRTSIKDWKDFDKLVGDGGCQERCGAQLPCGHICPRRCHTDDRSHTLYKCSRVVPVLLPCGHVIKNIACHRAEQKKSIRCEEMVSIVPKNCPSNHEYKMPCWESQKKSINCTHIVEITLPFCGHKMKTPCWKRGSIKATDCTQKCGMLLEGCLHECGNVCGDCVKLTVESGRTIRENRRAESMVHKPCNLVCDRPLLCGHSCKSNCHQGGVCPPCKEKCEMKCMHKRGGCGKTCDDPCVPCAEDCMWECSHRGKCTLPCGGPCNRLPCDKRCEKTLECGCQCPCICGEPCPSQKFCKKHAPETVQSQVVDQIMFTTFSDLTDEDLETDPLVVLECGHVATKSTMDGWMGLNSAYETDAFGEWLRPKPLAPEIEKMKVCFTCRTPIMGLFRYGRCINKLSLDLMELKFLKDCDANLERAHISLKKAMEGAENVKEERLAPSQQSGESIDSYLEIIKLQRLTMEAQQNFVRVASKAKRPPKLAIYEKLKATILADGGSQEQIDATGCPKPDFTRSCKGAIGVVSSGSVWVHLQTHLFQRIRRDGRVAVHENNAAFETTCHRVAKHAREAKALAVASKSLTLEVKLYLAWVEFLWKKIEYLRATSAQTWRIEEILKQAGDLVEVGISKSTSPEQRNQFHRMKKLIEKPGRAEVLDLLATVVQHDDTFVSTDGAGHIYTCPNGHIYIIANCGQAMQTSTCPECGETIGGRSHQLVGENARAENIAEEIASRRG
ncbi:hypothetical protein BSKO_05685 [Bryopsis sp. KO-2023]|nr:hypothetical protein BSKO_05685 [Bryopsis sp. KO-2023]